MDEHVIKRVESMVKDEKQPIMNWGLPCFEWEPGVPIDDLVGIDKERQLTIANAEETVEEDERQILVQPEQGDVFDPIEGDEIHYDHNGDEIIEDDVVVGIDNDERLIVMPEDHTISKEESFVKEIESDSNDAQSIGNEGEAEEVIVADIDDDGDIIPSNVGPRRINAGADVERIQMDFSGKGYGARV